MKSLFDIMIEQILKTEKEKAKEKAKLLKSQKDEPDKKEAETLEEKAKQQVKRRAEKKLAEAMKKQAAEIDEAMAKGKRQVRALRQEEEKKQKTDAYVASLTAPTARLQWECVGGNPHHLRAALNGESFFEIKRGIATFKLYLMDSKLKEGVSLKKRAEKVKVGGIHSSHNVYALKTNAEKLLKRIEELELKLKEAEQNRAK